MPLVISFNVQIILLATGIIFLLLSIVYVRTRKKIRLEWESGFGREFAMRANTVFHTDEELDFFARINHFRANRGIELLQIDKISHDLSAITLRKMISTGMLVMTGDGKIFEKDLRPNGATKCSSFFSCKTTSAISAFNELPAIIDDAALTHIGVSAEMNNGKFYCVCIFVQYPKSKQL